MLPFFTYYPVYCAPLAMFYGPILLRITRWSLLLLFPLLQLFLGQLNGLTGVGVNCLMWVLSRLPYLRLWTGNIVQRFVYIELLDVPWCDHARTMRDLWPGDWVQFKGHARAHWLDHMPYFRAASCIVRAFATALERDYGCRWAGSFIPC